jgi:U6 snRNA-associated Sm-like protein LSm1
MLQVVVLADLTSYHTSSEMCVLHTDTRVCAHASQFVVTANIVLEGTVERIFIDDRYGERNVGLYLVRGENVVLIGEIVSTQLL